ncbi:MAG: SET domain-containing protein [Saprospiraceae bacterium]
MIHPNTTLRLINPTVGYGVFATQFIPEGTIVYVKDSLELEISPTDYLMHTREMQEVIEKYSYIDERGYRIISWDFAKYVNHCCNCNTISTGYGFELAIRDIQPGEQITDEYGIFNLENEMELICGEMGCRKKVQPSDFEKYYQAWDEKIKQSMKKLFEVEQPLICFIEESTRKSLDYYFAHPKSYKSVYSLRYKKVENGVASRTASV